MHSFYIELLFHVFIIACCEPVVQDHR